MILSKLEALYIFQTLNISINMKSHYALASKTSRLSSRSLSSRLWSSSISFFMRIFLHFKVAISSCIIAMSFCSSPFCCPSFVCCSFSVMFSGFSIEPPMFLPVVSVFVFLLRPMCFCNASGLPLSNS